MQVEQNQTTAPLRMLKRESLPCITVTDSSASTSPMAKRRKMARPESDKWNSFESINEVGGIVRHVSYANAINSQFSSARMHNLRIVSESSVRGSVTSDRNMRNSNASFTSNINTTMGNRSDDSTNKNGIRYNTTGVSASSVHQALYSIVTVLSLNSEGENAVANEIHRLALHTGSYQIGDCTCSKYTSTVTLTLHQVAMTIVSRNGIDIILKAMETFRTNSEIQEYGCMVLGNIMTLIYSSGITSIEKMILRTPAANASNSGTDICSRILSAMENHSSSVSVYCAAITALHCYRTSIFYVPSQSELEQEIHDIILQHSLEMFLPIHIHELARQLLAISRPLQ